MENEKIYLEELRDYMKEGVLKFIWKDLNGKKRIAIGTLSPVHISPSNHQEYLNQLGSDFDCIKFWNTKKKCYDTIFGYHDDVVTVIESYGM